VHTPDSAAAVIIDRVRALPEESVALPAARGRVLARDITSPIAFPPWDNSAMDGYAVRGDDLAAPGVELEIIEEIAAGAVPSRRLGPGRCARIFTGAPIPEGADTVIRQEDTTRLSPTLVRIDDLRDAGRNVRRRGEDLVAGTAVFRRGEWLRPAHLGVLATMAFDTVPVHRAPRVALLASGDEIVDLSRRDAILAGERIASSNSYTLEALIEETGGTVIDLGIARDDPEDLRRRIVGAAGADLLLTTAGVSVGEHDFLRDVMDGFGLAHGFWRIRMRPGAPVGFGILEGLGGIPWIGLPGNPVSTMVTYELFVRPALRRMLGHEGWFRRVRQVETAAPIQLGPPLRHFLRVTLTPGTDRPIAQLTGPQGSGILTSMARATALLIVPEDRPRVEAGEVLNAIVLDDPAFIPAIPF